MGWAFKDFRVDDLWRFRKMLLQGCQYFGFFTVQSLLAAIVWDVHGGSFEGLVLGSGVQAFELEGSRVDKFSEFEGLWCFNSMHFEFMLLAVSGRGILVRSCSVFREFQIGWRLRVQNLLPVCNNLRTPLLSFLPAPG